MVTDPIQHDRAKGVRRPLLRRHSRRVVRGASYSKYDTLYDLWGYNADERDSVEATGDGLFRQVGHGGFRLCLSLPCNDSMGVVQWGQEVTW